ncbi:MAG: VanW family protein [Anaerolineales bacterium]|nr:VanW family protein [Anaerolineales bacterium]
MDINYQPSHSSPSPEIAIGDKLIAAILGGLGVAIAFMLIFTLILAILFGGKILPGVVISGVDVGSLSQTEAETLLRERISYPETGLIAFEYQGEFWTFTPADLGLVLDYQATIQQAYAIGRTGWPWQQFSDRLAVMQAGKTLSPVLVVDQRVTRQVLGLLANQINQEMREANLELVGLEVVSQKGQIGRILDVEAVIQQLEEAMRSLLDASLPLVVHEFHPIVLDASQQAEIAAAMLAEPLIIQVSGNQNETLGPWEIAPQTLADMLVIDRSEQGEYLVKLDENTLFNTLYPLSPSLSITPQNARFIFKDETRELELIQDAVIGRELLVEESIDQINHRLAAGEHKINLVFDYINPEVTNDATAGELGITELVSAETTFFYGSDSSRIQNIETAAGQFHGILVAPGETFSMVDNIGDISLDSGYAEAWIIYGDRTVKGVGGGVCQVSTTLFRTVFFGGFPVVERWPHAYRVYYYELAQSGAVNENLAGLDASVYAPVVDFKFTNDTEHWLLMETYVNVANRSLTWKFYSTSDGRQVEWTTTGLTDKVKPPFPVYEENDELKKGKIKQVDWAVEGATVTITRTVTRDGAILYSDTFKTKYEPWAAVCQYGPGTEDYPPEGDQRDRFSCNVKD